MLDSRAKMIAKILVDYSTAVKKNENVLIYADIAAKDFGLEVYKLVLQRGAHVLDLVWTVPNEDKIFYTFAQKHQLTKFPKHLFNLIKDTDVVFLIDAPEDFKELERVSTEKISLHRKTLKSIFDWRIEKTRWIYFQYPTLAGAKLAGMSQKQFTDFVFNSCLVDWKKFTAHMYKLKRILNKVDEVRIVGWKTDLTLSVKGRTALVGHGTGNMPDGEVYTSVVDDSANGYITFEIPAVWLGNIIEGVRLEFKNGKAVKVITKKNARFLQKILSTDAGAKRIGELGFGLNYRINRSTKQILFDEKIGGTCHMAMGRAYKQTAGKNESAIHWDFIKDLRRNGKVFFDGELVMQNGKWLIH